MRKILIDSNMKKFFSLDDLFCEDKYKNHEVWRPFKKMQMADYIANYCKGSTFETVGATMYVPFIKTDEVVWSDDELCKEYYTHVLSNPDNYIRLYVIRTKTYKDRFVSYYESTLYFVSNPIDNEILATMLHVD